jgi:hypothetical protein
MHRECENLSLVGMETYICNYRHYAGLHLLHQELQSGRYSDTLKPTTVDRLKHCSRTFSFIVKPIPKAPTPDPLHTYLRSYSTAKVEHQSIKNFNILAMCNFWKTTYADCAHTTLEPILRCDYGPCNATSRPPAIYQPRHMPNICAVCAAPNQRPAGYHYPPMRGM